jgi:tRNA (cmo5U34)-methyltransferase
MIEGAPGAFVFDGRVVRVFPDMINRSVPGYGQIVAMMGLLARRYARDDSQGAAGDPRPGVAWLKASCPSGEPPSAASGSREARLLLYDLGCSLGAVALAMSQAVRARRVEIVAVDNSPAMIARLDEILAERPPPGCVPVRTRCADVMDCAIENASVVALNFTLQFVEPGSRRVLLRRIAAGLCPGGVLLLSEKVCFASADEQRLQTEWHHAFKRAQGYSEPEIARKREALERVMQPDSLPRHCQRLLESGFDRVYRWYQGFNFVSLIAFRGDR